MQILEKLEKLFLTEIAVDLGNKSLDPGEDLLEQGILDSMGIMKLIVFIEENFGMKVEDEEIIPENFQSLNSIVAFIGRKTQNK
jgi:acyl carrier protein